MLVYCLLSAVSVTGVLASPSTPSYQTLNQSITKDGNYFEFITRQDIQAPVWSINVADESAVSPGYWFIAPYEIKTQELAGDAWVGPHIYDSDGQLVWSGTPEFGHWNVFDFDSIEVDGEPYLSGLDWHGQRGVLLDNSYQLRKTAPSVTLGDTFQNMHGFQVIDNGQRALVQTVRHWDVPAEVTREMIGYDGPCDASYEGFRELDLDAPGGSRVIFDWDARKIGLNESTYVKTRGVQYLCQTGWDLLHVNSITKFPDGDYLLSARHTDALYKISHIDGEIVWRLGGLMSDFKLGVGARFSRQHHARCVEQNETHTIISVFDNAVGEHYQKPSRHDSRGLVLALDTQQMTADVMMEYEDPRKAFTDGRGSFQLLPDGNAFINWAVSSRITEHAPDGTLLMQAELNARKDTYRAFKRHWIGKPASPPDVHAEVFWQEDRSIVTDVSMSWNGATEYTNWNVKGLDAEGNPIVIASGVPRSGFETGIQYQGYAANVYVEALDCDGNILGTSEGGIRLSSVEQPPVQSSMRTQIEISIGRGSLGLLLALTGFLVIHWYRQRKRAVSCVEKGSYMKVEQEEEV